VSKVPATKVTGNTIDPLASSASGVALRIAGRLAAKVVVIVVVSVVLVKSKALAVGVELVDWVELVCVVVCMELVRDVVRTVELADTVVVGVAEVVVLEVTVGVDVLVSELVVDAKLAEQNPHDLSH